MTAPTVTWSSGADTGTDGTSVAATMPASIASGDLLLAFASYDSTTAPTTPTDWTVVFSDITTSASGSLHVFARIAAGSDTLTIAGPAQDYVIRVGKIAAAEHGVATIATDIEVSAAGKAGGSATTTMNPPSLDTGAVKDWLFIAAGCADWGGSGASISGYPTGYTDVQRTNSVSPTTSSSVGQGIATLAATARIEDPATFTLSTGRQWVTATIAVPPPGDATGGTLGKIDDGANNTATSAARQFCSTFTASEDGTLISGHIRCYVQTGGSAPVKCVVWADNAGAPGALLAVSDEITVADGTLSWRSLPFSGAQQIALTSGTPYWVGAHHDDPGTQSFVVHRAATSAAVKTAGRAYASGPADPFGGTNDQNGPSDIHVVYEVAATGTDAVASTVTVLVEVPAPTVTILQPIASTVVTVSAEVPSPTVETAVSATATPGVVSAVVVVPASTVSVSESAVPTPDVVTAAVVVPSPTLATGAAPAPPVVTAVAEVLSPVITATAGIVAGVVEAAVEVPSPAIDDGPTTETLGKTTDGANNTNTSNARQFCSVFTASEDGTLISGHARCRISTGSEDAGAKIVVWADNAGEPGALLAVSDEVILADTTIQWRSFDFTGAQQIALTSGTPYWIGMHHDDPGTAGVQVFRDATTDAVRTAGRTYASGPADPFGSSTLQNGPTDIYVTYAVEAAPAPSVVTAPAVIPTATVVTESPLTPTVVTAAVLIPAWDGSVLTDVDGNVLTDVDGNVLTTTGAMVRTDQPIAPAVVTAVVDVPTPTIAAAESATATPSVVTALAVVPSPTITTAAVGVAGAVEAAAVVPSPSISATVAVVAGAVTGAVVVPATTVTATATATAAVVTAAAVVPTPVIGTAESATPQPDVVTAAAVIPAPTLTASAGAAPAVVTAPVDIPAPATSPQSAATPATVDAAVDIPAPSVDASASPVGAVVEASAEVPSPAVSTDSSTAVPAPTVTVLVVVPAPAALASSTAGPDSLTVLVEIPTPTIAATGTAPAPVVTALVEILGPTVTAATDAVLAAVTLPVGIPAPSIEALTAAVASAVTLTVDIPSPTVPLGVSLTVVAASRPIVTWTGSAPSVAWAGTEPTVAWSGGPPRSSP